MKLRNAVLLVFLAWFVGYVVGRYQGEWYVRNNLWTMPR